jgi:hypothetical protein
VRVSYNLDTLIGATLLRLVKMMKGALTVAALIVLLFSAQAPCAAEIACAGLSAADANDLVDIPGIAAERHPSASSVKCISEGLGRGSHFCEEKTTIVQDQMLGHDRRLVVARSSDSGQAPLDYVFVFGCVAGQVKPVLDFYPVFIDEKVKVESATAEKVIVVSERTGEGHSSDRNVFIWSRKLQRYLPEGSDGSDVSPVSLKTLSCNKLKTAKTDSLILIANGDFASGEGGYPFTHGVGCYPDKNNCEWEVELDEDRMIGDNRRLIVLDSDHKQGTGTWGYVEVFGCVAGQLRAVFGSEFLYGADVEDVSADKLTVSTLTGADGGYAGCCPSVEVLKTFVWKAGLQNYVLSSEHYRPSK